MPARFVHISRPVYFLLIEDESGLLQATIFNDTYQRHGHHLYRAASFLLEGVVEQDERRGFSFVVERLEDLGGLLPRMPEGNRSVSGAMLRAPKPDTSRPAKRRRAG